MKQGIWCAVLACMLAGQCALAQTAQPTAVIIADGVQYPVGVFPSGDGKTYSIGDPEAGGVLIQTADYLITLSGLMDPDPSIAYGLAVTDFGAPSSFAFIFSTPIVPVGTPNVVDASIVGGLTDFTGDGASITPTLLDMDGDTIAEVQVAEVFGPLTNMGVDVGPSLVVGAGPAGALTSYGSHTFGPIAGPGPGPWTGLQTTTAFSLSGGGDIVSLTGFAQIVIPEPASMGLMGLGLMMLIRRNR